MKMDWSEKNLCIKCNEGGNLLVCSENGCPLSIHERCMGCPASFDDAGQFYCPYCLYKQAVAEARQAREYALSRKKALLIFMDEEKKGGEEEKNLEENKRDEDNGQNQPKDSAANANTTCEKVRVAEEENIVEEESEPSECSENEEPSELKNSNEEEKQIEHEEGENAADCGGEDENKVCNEKEKKIEHEEGENSADCDGEDENKVCNGEEVFETSSASTGKDSPKPMSFKRKKVMEKVRKSHKSKQTSPSVNKRASRPSPSRSIVKMGDGMFGTGKRKRLYWREDEEEMLKSGVEKFAKEANKNLPWRKILELGRHVFDGTRTPGDLRDKWRNMLAK